MATLTCSYDSLALNKKTTFNIILPDRRTEGETFPVLYLLHGLTDDYNTWLSYTSISRYVRYSKIAIIMPDALKSFYTDMKYGDNYYTFIAEELPKWCQIQFNLSNKREDNFIAGLSMGGYGALKIGLSNCDRFSAIGAFSPVCDCSEFASDMPDLKISIVGHEDFTNGENDLYFLANEAKKADKIPSIYHWCGSEDFMINQNRKFSEYISNQPDFDYTYKESPGGHSWDNWDREIYNFLKFIKVKKISY